MGRRDAFRVSGGGSPCGAAACSSRRPRSRATGAAFEASSARLEANDGETPRSQLRHEQEDHMLVREVMTGGLVAVGVDTSVSEARDIMRKERIRHLLVLDQGRLAGIVTDRDIRSALPSQATSLSIWE